MTKVLFVCFFYSALFPASFLFGFVILLVQYHVDKFCLLRIWGFSPSLGNSLAVYSRRYFFTGATVAFIIASAYAWAQFRECSSVLQTPLVSCCRHLSQASPLNIHFFQKHMIMSATHLKLEAMLRGPKSPTRSFWRARQNPSLCSRNLRLFSSSKRSLSTTVLRDSWTMMALRFLPGSATSPNCPCH